MVAGKQPTGWPREELFDERDKYYVPKKYFNLTKLSPLNLRTHSEYKTYFAKVYNQSPSPTKLDAECWSTCAANATAAAFAYEWNRQGLPAIDPSRLFIYYNARRLAWDSDNSPQDDPKSKVPGDQGTLIRLAFKTLGKLGVCTEADWGYDDEHFAKQPEDDIISEALENHTVEYARLDPDQPEGVEKHMTADEKDTIGAMTLLRLRQCLAEGFPVAFGIRYYWAEPPFTKDHESGFWTLPPLPSKDGPPKDEEGNDFGGHAVLAIGFDDERKRILCQNSWGEDDSVEGAPLFWIGYDWIKDFEATSDFWMTRLVEKK